jgi:DNA-binding response OmpR family regulator
MMAQAAHILVVEDDLGIADVISQILHLEGYHVSHVLDGQTAVECVRHHPPDLVLMDLMLPVLSGIEASRAIKASADPSVAQVPIIAMSAGVSLRVAIDGLPVDGILAKPFDLDELIALVHSQVCPVSASG